MTCPEERAFFSFIFKMYNAGSWLKSSRNLLFSLTLTTCLYDCFTQENDRYKRLKSRMQSLKAGPKKVGPKVSIEGRNMGY